MSFKHPFGHSSIGAGGTDVLAEKRDYGWLRRVYGQICYASALGATSNWGQVTVPTPGVTKDNKFGIPAYLLPGTRISKVSAGGTSNFDDTEDERIPAFDPNTGRPKLDSKGEIIYETAPKNKYIAPESAQRDAEGKRKSSKDRASSDDDEDSPTTVYERDDVYAPAAHVVSISTNATANGMREEGTVTVKSYNGLHVGGPSLYGGMGMSWGYADFTGKIIRACAFGGVCNGGSVTLDSDGGYTVTVSGFKPIAALVGQYSSPTLAAGGVSITTDGLGQQFVGNNALSLAGEKDAKGKSGEKPSGPYSEVPYNFGIVVNKDAKSDKKGTAYRYHEKMGRIIEILNEILGKEGGSQIVYETKYSNQDRMNEVPHSAYPFKVLYGSSDPINGTAGEAFQGGAVKWDSPGKGFLNVAFSGEYLCKVAAENTNTQTFDNNGIGKGLNIISFINGLIQLANDCCGNAFGSLQCMFSADRDDKNIYIVDPTYSPGGPGGGGAGFPRTATISFKTSLEMDAAYVTAVAKGTAPGAAAVDAIWGGGSVSRPGSATYADACKAVASNAIDENCAALQATLITTSGNGMMPIPADLSVTTDGTCVKFNPYAFFGSGHVPTGAIRPPSGKSVGFICTSVAQSVSGGDWTTTISGTAVIR